MHTRHYGLGAEALDDKTGAGRTGRDRRPDPGARPELTELTRHTADRVAQQVVRAVIKHENRILLQRPTDDLREKDGNLSDETRSILDKYMREADPQQVIGWARARSPLSYVDSIDRNRPATLMIQSWNETVFLPDQMGRLNDRLTGPHQLEVVPGEHAAAETSGLLGLPNESWEHVYRWFDKHLRGPGNPAHEPPVVAKPRGGTDRPRESYPDWQHVANRAERFTMAPGGKLSAGETGGTSQPTTIKSGVDTIADGGLPLVTYTAEALSGHPSATFLPAVDRKHGAVWTSDPLPENRRLRGGPAPAHHHQAQHGGRNAGVLPLRRGPGRAGEMVSEGRPADELYLRQFCFEEAKHTHGFRRWLDAVGAEDDLHAHVTENPRHRAIFCEALPESLAELDRDPSPANQVRASITYHHPVEGVLALTGYFVWNQACERNGILPGMRELIQRISDDERRHMAWSTFTCRRHVAGNDANWDVVQERMNALLPHAISNIEWSMNQLEGDPFDMQLDDLSEYATDRATRRLRAIESARGADVARMDVNAEPERLEDEFGAEDQAALNAT